MRYWVGATSCQMQFLLGGYSLGQPGLVMEPLSLVRNPPQAAGGGGGQERCHHPPGAPTLGRGQRQVRELGLLDSLQPWGFCQEREGSRQGKEGIFRV